MDYLPPSQDCNIAVVKAFSRPEHLGLNPENYFYKHTNYSESAASIGEKSSLFIADMDYQQFAVKPIWGKFAKSIGQSSNMACIHLNSETIQ